MRSTTWVTTTTVGDLWNETKEISDFYSDARDKKLRKILKLTSHLQNEDLILVLYKSGSIHSHLISIQKLGD